MARPKTHGVRVLVRHAETGAILLVRHSYGRRDLWYPPGGGYKPGRETAEQAAHRELKEETGIVVDALKCLGTHVTTRAGNRDTITIFQGISESDPQSESSEIEECRWINLDKTNSGVKPSWVVPIALNMEVSAGQDNE